jgi:plasmid stabilization system protein ParE
MAAELIVAPEAARDLGEAYSWYGAQRPGRGDDSLDRADGYLHGILRHPESHALFFEHYRRDVVRKFPYVIFCEYENKIATAYSVFHTAQGPMKWRHRLP